MPLPRRTSVSASGRTGRRKWPGTCRSATGRVPLPLSDPGVLKDLKKVLAGEKLSPVLLAEGDIADGYHRVSLAYALDPYAEVPLKLAAAPSS